MSEAAFPFDSQAIHDCGFEDMRLQPGSRVEIQRLPASLNPRLFTTVIGYAPGESLLLRMPLVNGLSAEIHEGDRALVRAFSGTHAFGFASDIQRLCIVPFLYLHLSWPERVQCVEIRHTRRLPVCLPAEIRLAGSWHPVVMRDLAEGGCLIECAQALDGAEVALQLRFGFAVAHLDQSVTLTVAGRLHGGEAHQAADGAVVHRYGIEFEGLTADDAVRLQNYLFHLLLDQPAAA